MNSMVIYSRFVYVYSEQTDARHLQKIMDELIVKNEKRASVFALSYK